MSLIINTNTIATQTRNYLATNQTNLQRSLGRLASGSRIVKPSDDAGGLAVGNKLTATLNRNSRAQQMYNLSPFYRSRRRTIIGKIWYERTQDDVLGRPRTRLISPTTMLSLTNYRTNWLS